MQVTIDSEKIYLYMITNQTTKKQFAKDCGLSIVSLNKILKGDESVSLLTIMKICKKMNVSLKEIAKV